MSESGLQKIVAELAKRAQKQAADEIVEVQIRVVSGTFDKLVTYTNLLVLAGYATFFGLWQVTKEMIDPRLSMLAAFFTAVSASVFVLFEVFRGYIHSLSLVKLDQIILGAAATDAQRLTQAIGEHSKAERVMNARILPVWRVIFLVTVLTGVAGIGILLWAFLSHLLDGILM